MSGIVYLLTNEAMPGLVKIGKTTGDDPQVRMDQLYNTSVPVPFECALAVRVEEPSELEKALHKAFGPDRVNPKREFFKIDIEQAAALLRVVGKEDVTPSVNEANNTISSEERSSSETLRKRLPNINFSDMGIPVGATLCSVSGEETAEVVGDRKVKFKGREMSITAATRECLDRDNIGAPSRHWSYNGRNLREIYTETYILFGQ